VSESAIDAYGILLKIVSTPPDPTVIFQALNFICDRITRFDSRQVGEFRFVDEIFCQVTKLTFRNPDEYVLDIAWSIK
jgi:hypothetical protein